MPELVLLQQLQQDRYKLLRFLLSNGVLKKVVMPSGAKTLEDINLDEVSVDYVLECAEKETVLEISEAVKRYYNDLDLPLMMGSAFSQTVYVASNVDSSGPASSCLPNLVLAETASVEASHNSFSMVSTASQQVSVNELINDIEDDDDRESRPKIALYQPNDTNGLILELPPLKTGLTGDDLRKTAYEILLASIGGVRGLPLPAVKEKNQVKKSKFVRKFTGHISHKHKHQSSQKPDLGDLLENIRTQMEIPEAMDWLTRHSLLNVSVGSGGKRIDTLLIPLELLCTVSHVDFPDQKAYTRWKKRQVNVLEEGLLNHPSIPMEESDHRESELRTLFKELREAEGLPSALGSAQRSESLMAVRNIVLSLAKRVSREDQIEEVCHWADGYHLNILLYGKLLCAVFDILDEGKLVKDTDEIMELLKFSWKILGITQNVHDLCYTWVLFHQFVLTGEEDLLRHALFHIKRFSANSQQSPQERSYMKTLRSCKEGADGSRELTFVESVVLPIKQWVDKRMEDYTTSFTNASKMDPLLTLAVVSGTLLGDEKAQSGITRMESAAETDAVAKQLENYITSSAKAAFNKALQEVHIKCEKANEHFLALLAVAIQTLVKKDTEEFGPILSRWHPHAVPLCATLYHNFYHQQLKPFLDGVSILTDDVASVLSGAYSLEQYLMGLNMSGSTERDTFFYKDEIEPFKVEEISTTLMMHWVSMQVTRVSEWVDRTLQQEKWEPLSNQQQHGVSIIEVFRIIEEATEQFFSLKLPIHFPVMKSLATGLGNALQIYSSRVVNQLGVKEVLIPPPPGLTRYGKEVFNIKKFTKKGISYINPSDTRNSGQLNLLSVSKLCVRLNTLYFMLNQLKILEGNIKDLWLKIQPHNNNLGDTSDTEFPPNFDLTRKLANDSIERISEFLGIKVVFWDLRDLFIDGLYKGGVSESEISNVITSLDSVLGQICETIVEPLRNQVVLGLLRASSDGMARVLLDGGPTRFFSQEDALVLEEDLGALKELFEADGEGLQREVVDNLSSRVKKIVELYKMDARLIIERLRGTSNLHMIEMGPRKDLATENDEYTLLRVLCHKMDSEASAFLKKQYKIPKSHHKRKVET
ncbi:hypothetical protein KP509_38G054500 [Ceratopteris richardii]|nr:hypothetical protein KP509_38G054500 [Ceratopteris richardii]